MAYCGKDDLLIGDVRLGSKYGDGSSFVNLASDEIDSQIGHIYITPVVFDESTVAKAARSRPAKLLLKKINTLLASGRLILDQAMSGEDDNLHAYGRSMVNEANNLLRDITNGKISLFGAELIPEDDATEDSAPRILNEDDYSLVQAFYGQFDGSYAHGIDTRIPIRPYGGVN